MAAGVSTRQNISDWVKLLPVVFVSAIILGIYLIYTFLHLKPMLYTDSEFDTGICELIILNVITGLLVCCYIRCILTHPGTIPDNDPKWDYVPIDQRRICTDVQETKRSGDQRHCKWCAKYKPDRCHHCRVCRCCILKMDHHCPWIMNCVGFRNHKFFLLLIFYVTIDCHFVMWTMLTTVTSSVYSNAPFLTMFFLLFGETLIGFLGLLSTAFFTFHVWLVLKAMTTIEFCEKSMKGGSMSSGHNGFDRGCIGNIKAALGENPCFFLFPCCPPQGDGFSFTVESTRLRQDSDPGRRRKHHHKTQASDPFLGAEGQSRSRSDCSSVESGSGSDQEKPEVRENETPAAPCHDIEAPVMQPPDNEPLNTEPLGTELNDSEVHNIAFHGIAPHNDEAPDTEAHEVHGHDSEAYDDHPQDNHAHLSPRIVSESSKDVSND